MRRLVALLMICAGCRRSPTTIRPDDAASPKKSAPAPQHPTSPHTSVFPCAAFGLAAMSHERVGYEWFSWESSRAGKDYDAAHVFVVVYDSISLRDATRLYLDRYGRPRDIHGVEYRFVSSDKALQYLDGQPALQETRDAVLRLRTARPR